ncbi:hypothetical protein [Phycicoccus sp. Root101]|uniref:hypothetical protein n=1 Tax=Phycicoccus sp. Root101 TaxID=1736421 RepID=UPI0007031AB3|nr:hypothetical protein [Phycicoccus sp. Root101]KQU68244.1 hypothetical protein ASC58_11875 [Phycicoccus sp. Root101]
MSALDDLNAGPGGIAGFVTSLTRRMRPVSRRDVFVGAAVAGSALATRPKDYVLRPQPAYATICGPGNTASSGWTVFCATVNKGANTCPPGSFAAGWWKAADSSWCGGGYRYIVDCNASCSKCSTGCTDGICDSKCWSCSCGTGSSATCDQRRVCCNAFRYGQCNTQVKCSGGVHCRVVSCVAPYKWDACTTTSLQDNRTNEHSSPLLPRWGVIEKKYRDMGAQGSFLKSSLGPIKDNGDNRGTRVDYQGGSIHTNSRTGTRAVPNVVKTVWTQVDGVKGLLGYPASDWMTGRAQGGWVQLFERGAIADSPSTAPKVVYADAYTLWVSEGRESGRLGYPISNRYSGMVDGGWRQEFQSGCVVDSASTTIQSVWSVRWDVWKREGRETGRLGYPVAPKEDLGNGAWVQRFQKGCIIDSASTTTQAISGVIHTAWVAGGRDQGWLHFPTGAQGTAARGVYQSFQGGDVWALGTGPGRRVLGSVRAEWKAQGGATGPYGYPLTDTRRLADGTMTCTFEGGTITVAP